MQPQSSNEFHVLLPSKKDCIAPFIWQQMQLNFNKWISFAKGRDKIHPPLIIHQFNISPSIYYNTLLMENTIILKLLKVFIFYWNDNWNIYDSLNLQTKINGQWPYFTLKVTTLYHWAPWTNNEYNVTLEVTKMVQFYPLANVTLTRGI